MRVLFFVEPFPVRNSMAHFKDIAKRAMSLCTFDGVVDMRVYANSETLGLASSGAAESAKARLIWPTEDEDAYFQSQQVPWEAEGISLWSECMRGGPASAPYIAVLERLRIEFPFDAIVHWGENGAVSRFADERDLTHIGMELGCTRKPFRDSYVLDPAGTNGAALVPRLSIGDIERIVDGRETSAEASVLGCAENAECAIYDHRFLMLPPHLSARLMQGRRKIAFLALQLYDDANLIRFSPYADLREVVLDVVPKLVAADYTIVIKPHPSSCYRPGASQANDEALSALSAYSEHVVWFDDPKSSVPNSRLMQIADLVVTVNSSVGFEALYFDKLVVVLGEAVYKPSGAFPSLDEAISGRFDVGAYLRNIGLLRTYFLDAYLVEEKWIADPASFAHRVSTLVGIQRQFRGDHAAVANALYAAFAPAGRFLHERTLAAGNPSSTPEKFVTAKSKRASGSVFRDGFDVRPLVDVLKRSSAADDVPGVKRWLRDQWLDDGSRRNVLRLVGAVDEAWYAEKTPQVKNKGRDAVEHFSDLGEKKGRVPSPSIDPQVYSRLPAPQYLHALLDVLDLETAGAIDASVPLSADESAALRFADAQIAKLLERPRRRIAVVAHLYYLDLVEPLLDDLAHIPGDFDLLVTLPRWGYRAIEEKVRSRFGDAVCLPLPNRGRDVAPFLYVLPALIRREYDAVLKTHTKKGYYHASRLKARLGDAWREYAWNCLFGSEAVVAEILRGFESDEALAMVGPSELLVRTRDYPVEIDRDTARSVGFDEFDAEDAFFAGTMFWMRPPAFSRMAVDRFSFERFSGDPENSHGELEHAVERLFGSLARGGGYRIAGTELDTLTGEIRFNASVAPNSRPLAEVMEGLAETLKTRRSRRPSASVVHADSR